MSTRLYNVRNGDYLVEEKHSVYQSFRTGRKICKTPGHFDPQTVYVLISSITLNVAG